MLMCGHASYVSCDDADVLPCDLDVTHVAGPTKVMSMVRMTPLSGTMNGKNMAHAQA